MDLKAEQEKTLSTPVLKANFILKIMYLTMDLIYGFKGSLLKFKVIEILARYPYWAWENGSYSKISKLYARTKYNCKKASEASLRHIDMGRRSQDNEQWHLLIIEDIMRQKGIKQGFIRAFLLPRIMAFKYLLLTRFLYWLNPKITFSMNAKFESHAEHEYMKIVKAHPEWENEPVDTIWFNEYPRQKTMADLFRRIGLDERGHMNESLEELKR